MVKRRGKTLYVYFKPFKDKKIGIRVDAATIREAEQIEGAVLRACRTGNFAGLDLISRGTCIRMFQNQGWELPPDLVPPDLRPQEELTLWGAAQLFLKDPEIRDCARRWRHEIALANIMVKIGKGFPLKSLRVSHLKTYRVQRLNEGAAPASVNIEISTLSRLFGVMGEHEIVETNPCSLLKRLSTRSGERQVYLAYEDVKLITEQCPDWFRPIVWTAFYSGMRRGELLSLTRKEINLAKRMITLAPEHTKEAHWKRVPIHRDLVPILEEAQRVTCLGTDHVFVLIDGQRVRPLELETFKNPWPRACESLELLEPWPRFHDLRHTWRTNARRSGMDPQIAESIMGHWFKGKSVNNRYGRIGDKELLQAIDNMTFDHGETEILVATDKTPKKALKKKASGGKGNKKGNKKETNGGLQEKRPCAARA